MTDKEIIAKRIIKGLECCDNEYPPCVYCPYEISGLNLCKKHLIGDAYYLVKTQQAEIERLKEEHDKNFEKWEILDKRTKERYAELYEEAKGVVRAKAIKEFAEELKHGYFRGFNTYGIGAIHARIDAAVKEAVKEMAGGSDG